MKVDVLRKKVEEAEKTVQLGRFSISKFKDIVVRREGIEISDRSKYKISADVEIPFSDEEVSKMMGVLKKLGYKQTK